jgi:hypothetical protein
MMYWLLATAVVLVVALEVSIVIAIKHRVPVFRSPVSWDRFWHNLDKFLAIFLFLIVLGVAVHMLHHNSDSGSITWIEGIVGQLLTAITTLLGISRLLPRIKDGNGSDKNNAKQHSQNDKQ